ncbi:LuxR family transcriptional regulator [uncultured Pelagimonas sp.]|uniref:helix-turn-helix transcriptional regulator n=1 Tax=uncultured Pelagimonas sp. TaxID=1618102 RepID=UPI002610312A|nr:LuxR family transcriptional regulator [uncultured Pelagimonas sp.]
MSKHVKREFLSLKERSFGPRIMMLAFLIVLQAASALFFVDDAFTDYQAIGMDPHTTYEAIAVIALVVGVVFGAFEMLRSVRLWKQAETTLDQTRKAFAEMVRERFEYWNLTKSEAEVALLTLKGFDIREIAKFRDTADGTVRAQLSKIYVKSGMGNRGQFVSLFIDELLDSDAYADTFGKMQ